MFVIIDMEGSTLDTFDDAPSATVFLDELLGTTPAAADEVGVIEYRDGHRLGPPMFAADFIARSRTALFQAVIARALQNVLIHQVAVINATADEPDRASIDISIPSGGTDYWNGVVRQSRGHRFPLAA